MDVWALPRTRTSSKAPFINKEVMINEIAKSEIFLEAVKLTSTELSRIWPK